ncbi:MAG: hypothetical protein K0R11_1499 [Acidimicrobiales bacterium]|nr:hypothetical protein [Acidimicrobiales bacterium]
MSGPSGERLTDAATNGDHRAAPPAPGAIIS